MKKLRIKIVLSVLLSATAVFAMTIFIFWICSGISIARGADIFTSVIERYNGNLPLIELLRQELKDAGLHYTIDAETPYRSRYFTVTFNGNEALVNTEHIAAIDDDTAVLMAAEAMSRTSKVGYCDNYRYRVSDDEGMVVFLDNTDDINSMNSLLLIISLIAVAFVALITLVFTFLSGRIVRPFVENARMQKQFITDASHELKTPLAIISANAEVLAYKDGENEWINNITTQVKRVSDLVNEMLTLNRLEEIEEISDIEPVQFSQMTDSIAVTFEEVLLGKNSQLIRDIQPDVTVNGNPAQLERLVSVLTENASKYVSDNGIVKVTLRQTPRYTQLSIYNTCEIDPEADYTHLFDRFYRPDSSRTSKTGGHGIGLSIAKRIVTLHNGSIEAMPSAEGMTFAVKLPNRLRIRIRNKGESSEQ